MHPFYLHQEMHSGVQDLFCQVVAHSESWVKVEMIFFKLFMYVDRCGCLVKLVCLYQCDQRSFLPLTVKHPGFPDGLDFSRLLRIFLKLCWKVKKTLTKQLTI